MTFARFAIILSACIAALTAGPASGQAYPNKVVRIITAEPGGGYDFAARLVAQGLSGPLGQQIIIENRGGILAELVSKAPPDGYTFLVSGNDMWLQPFFHTTNYDPVRDFAPISLLNSSPTVLVVHPSLPVQSVAELIALAKSKPGKLNYGTGNAGSIGHLTTEKFAAATGIKIVRIPYKGGGPAMNALVGAQVDLIFGTGGTVAPHLAAGRLKPLAVTSAAPSALFPGVPAVAATLPGFESVGLVGILAPAQTPAPIIERWSQEIGRLLARSDVKERFFTSGVEAGGSTPEQFAGIIRADMASTGKLIKEAGLNTQ